MPNLEALRRDYSSLIKASKRLNFAAHSQEIKVALLSDASTQRFVPLLRTLFSEKGFHASVYEGAFDAIQLETVSAESALYQFAPNLIAVFNAVQALRTRFFTRRGDATAFFEEEIRRIVSVWEAIRQRCAATIIQSNFVMPYERYFGNFDQKVKDSFTSIVARLNARIAEEACSYSSVLINDVESIASWTGRCHWFDDRFWDLAKSFCSVDCLPAVAQNIVDIGLCVRGRTVKCVVLDLDNTLWGGVIGDDGLDGIILSAHGEGECFWRFQSYLKELRKRGILLAVCSKNDMNNALLPFDKHPDMVLRREDITVFVANWKDKAENIRDISETLNIGVDSMVFLDDNPFERKLVSGILPQVIVPELPEDAADYVSALSALNLFETVSFSAEDLNRAELYRVEAERKRVQGSFADAAEFLKSIDMRIHVARFDSFHLPRIAQLVQRSNQFNLTTHRYTEAECEALMNDPEVLPLYARLSDRLGDHGLISLVVVEAIGEELVIRDWLMSCRVLARGVEQYLMNLVFEEAGKRGLIAVRGEYIKTAKNQMVEDFFPRFGFKAAGGDTSRTHWTLDIDNYKPHETFISAVEEKTAAVD
jgi:FkbH-like protein